MSLIKSASWGMGLMLAAGIASADITPSQTLTTTTTGQPVLFAGDVATATSTVFGTGTVDYFFDLAATGPTGGGVTSLDLNLGNGVSYGFSGLSLALTDTDTHTTYVTEGPSPGGEGFTFPSGLPTGDYELAVNYTTSGTQGGIYTAAISVVPLPSAAWLLLSGVAGVAAMTRGRKSRAAS
jgi:hypothetical protein